MICLYVTFSNCNICFDSFITQINFEPIYRGFAQQLVSGHILSF